MCISMFIEIYISVRVYVFKKKKISSPIKSYLYPVLIWRGAYSRKNMNGFNLLTSALEASLRLKKRNYWLSVSLSQPRT